jgi:hypothetical protein
LHGVKGRGIFGTFNGELHCFGNTFGGVKAEGLILMNLKVLWAAEGTCSNEIGFGYTRSLRLKTEERQNPYVE